MVAILAGVLKRVHINTILFFACIKTSDMWNHIALRFSWRRNLLLELRLNFPSRQAFDSVAEAGMDGTRWRTCR
jgi:hypothetical protein